MKIDTIYIACYKYDVRLTRSLIASIRMWYPDLPVCLIKDCLYGEFDTTEIEKYWNVSVLPTQQRHFGWGVSKFEPLFLAVKQRFLVLDSDIVLAGPVLELLEQYSEDFIVQHEDPSKAFVGSHYFDLNALQQFDSQFVFPGFTFNTGQWVGTSGIFKRSDFDSFIQWSSPPVVKNPEVFKLGEQGLLNYFLMNKMLQGNVTLRRLLFMEVGDNPAVQSIHLDQLQTSSSYRFVIHWCGLRKPRIQDMCRGDIIQHFENLYYRRVPLGHLRKGLRAIGTWTEANFRLLMSRLGVKGIYRQLRSWLGRKA